MRDGEETTYARAVGGRRREEDDAGAARAVPTRTTHVRANPEDKAKASPRRRHNARAWDLILARIEDERSGDHVLTFVYMS